VYDFYYFALVPEKNEKRSLEFTVTLVDDDALFLETLKDYLHSVNITQVETFSSGEDFLASFQPKDSRFIVCDFDFGTTGNLNGLQVLEEVRRRNASTPVVILSSQDKLDIALKTLRSGALDYFIKGTESTFTTVMTSILKTNEIFKLKKDKKDFITLGIIGTVLFSILLLASYFYR